MQTCRHPVDIFVEGWGRLGSRWGVGKVMAEIQALLYLSARPMSLEEMAERLKISRSNISLNVRGLQDLGVVKKVVVPGDRKDYYAAEADVGEVARRLAAEKKRRELDPALGIVREALAAAVPGATAADVRRLEELERLLDTISRFFDAFIDTQVDGSDEKGRAHA